MSILSCLWPPLWSSGQSSWLQIQRSRFESRRYQIFREVVGLEQGSLSLVCTIEELLGRKSIGSLLENREYGRRDPLCWPHGTLYLQKLAPTSLTSGGSLLVLINILQEAAVLVSQVTGGNQQLNCIHIFIIFSNSFPSKRGVRCATSREVTDSVPDEITGFFNSPHPSSCTGPYF
jgi:hypothetical protein